jgi:hypothetical protein
VTEHTISAERGEVAITLEGVVYPMRPSGAAQMAIEEQLGLSLIDLWFRMGAMWKRATGEPSEGPAGLTLKQMAVVIAECVKAAGRDRKDVTLQAFTAERIADLIADNRMSYSEPLARLIGSTLTKEAKEADEKKA